MTVSNDVLQFPSSNGGEFQAFGSTFQNGVSWSNPIGPEFAAEAVAKASRAKVAAVPELLLADFIYAGMWNRWKVTLDRDVTVHTATGAALVTRTLYVGIAAPAGTAIDAAIHIPSAQQPDLQTLYTPDTLRRRTGFPLKYDLVTAITP